MAEETETLWQKMSELSKKISKTLSEGKMKADENLKEHPLPYLLGALAGGVAVGYLVAKKRKA